VREFCGRRHLSVAVLQDDRVVGVSRQTPTEGLAPPAEGLSSLRRLEREGEGEREREREGGGWGSELSHIYIYI